MFGAMYNMPMTGLPLFVYAGAGLVAVTAGGIAKLVSKVRRK